ncbi:MAG: hypothetical protein DMG54_10625 [Acidobacteria bacterium]|nr:MAG: hypothetical protein DMG54_10625 [Acidobacteriota bacterium]
MKRAPPQGRELGARCSVGEELKNAPRGENPNFYGALGIRRGHRGPRLASLARRRVALGYPTIDRTTNFWPRWALLILGFFILREWACTGITFLTIAAV